ncbi:hypothetical protein N7474_007596 [Penicillium riverlandense]|uniref:uncharacterized protein n=1 Tax=Penicillium riverlandense TaxID=1903569 RepID=UPI0025483303|nr:uncharacterized protein N7474_007596 [Penicillium riverlandense]KAJ5811295.1 hypothetical protein N7474_007596 [Penicillium riverlandense]
MAILVSLGALPAPSQGTAQACGKLAVVSPYATREASPWLRAATRPSITRRPRRIDPRHVPELNNANENLEDTWIEEEEEPEEEEGEEEDGPLESTPLLPIFSASHLDALPVYDITLAIRPLIAARCETTLSWEQLRSPQVSQFLVKPIQQQIMADHFSRATLYALMANCLQFQKEIHLHPENSGTSQTRAMVSELLAIKLLKDYSTRELIDALSYEFYPLQGQDPPPGLPQGPQRKRLAGAGRVSCLEVAIRAQAKRFLAHPVVVQQLEAIWAGTIVFHSAADNLHRRVKRVSTEGHNYGTAADHNGDSTPDSRTGSFRRSVTLYNPRDASLFKLSRLRVPRYRQFLSTLSFAVLLGLFLAVLQQHSGQITSLEIVFWLWSAGFMLDEIVGFNEQGFSLYLMSFWNLFDLGILLLLFCYYCLRICGAFLPGPDGMRLSDLAYDVLAACAVLLFPRLFSILDHYRYFSQLLIAFRIMASDLIAVFVLIIVACSGFFFAFLSFGDNHSPSEIAYGLFQMLMGFTPTAWSMWDEYNFLGRAILTIFLFICHFVVVTILITVLTNSFMRIVQNANQEHQFLFAVNTISMVKSDALFSYVAPANIVAWLVTPFRYLMPFRQFIRLNRTIIKITHLPILFTICFYEKTILTARAVEPMDLIEATSRAEAAGLAHNWQPRRFRAFSTRAPRLVREPSVATYHKDQALEEVFRENFGGSQVRRRPSTLHGNRSSSVIKDWMHEMGSGPVHPPDEQDPSEVDRLEMFPRRFRFPLRRNTLTRPRNFTETTHSVASNPEERISHADSPAFQPRRPRGLRSPTKAKAREPSQHTDMEGDDELTSEDGDSQDDQHSTKKAIDDDAEPVESTVKTSPKFYTSRPPTSRLASRRNSPNRRPRHQRTVSGVTMLYNPVESADEKSDGEMTHSRPNADSSDDDPVPLVSTSLDRGTMKRRPGDAGRIVSQGLSPISVPIMEPLYLPNRPATARPRPSLLFDLGSDLGDNKAVAGGFAGILPSSFNTNLPLATGGLRRSDMFSQPQDMLSKLVLARMNNIEEGFREVIKEVKDLRRGGSSRSRSRTDEIRPATRERKKRGERKEQKKRSQTSQDLPAGNDGDPSREQNAPDNATRPS